MSLSFHYLWLHLGIIICLSVLLSGNRVSPNTTVLDTSTSTTESTSESNTGSTTQSVTASTTESTTESTTDFLTESTVSASSVTETTSIKKLIEAKEKTTKPLVITDATKASPKTKKPSTSTETEPQKNTTTSSTTSTSSSPRSSTSNTTLTNTTSSATTTNSTSSTATTASATTSQIETITNGEGISVIKVHGKKKRLSLSDIASSPTTTTPVTNKPVSSKPRRKGGRKKKKRRPKKQKASSGITDGLTKKTPTQATTRKNDMTSITQKPTGPGKVTESLLTTAYPLSPDATIHNVEAEVKPVLFVAAAADNKKNGGGKKAGKKGQKKGGKSQGKKKGDTGPPGPPGPKGAKGEPGADAQSSMPMQAASSAVLTEHFGPDKDVIVPFDLKLIDLADNYDNTTGVFICTIPGVYVVSLYLMSHPGAKVNARVFINSRPIAALWADDSKNSGFYPSSSIQTVSRLAFGDQVYVMLVDGGYGESWVHANYNAFSLFLLYEDVFFR